MPSFYRHQLICVYRRSSSGYSSSIRNQLQTPCPSASSVHFTHWIPGINFSALPFYNHSLSETLTVIMFIKALSLALLTAVNIVSAVDMPTISAVGAKFFFSNGTQYYIKGKRLTSQLLSIPDHVNRRCLPAYLPRPSHQWNPVYARRCLNGRLRRQYYTSLSCRLDSRPRCMHECFCLLRHIPLARTYISE